MTLSSLRAAKCRGPAVSPLDSLRPRKAELSKAALRKCRHLLSLVGLRPPSTRSAPPPDSGQGLALHPRRRCHPAPAPEHFVPGPRARVLPLHPAQTLPPCTRLGGQSSKSPYAKAGLSLCLDGPAFACVVDISLDIVFSADIILAIMFDITARCCS